MIKNAYPITMMSDIYNKMSGKGLFSIEDVDRDFCQFIMASMTMRLMMFEYKKRHYMSRRMLFDLMGGPAIFNRNNEPII